MQRKKQKTADGDGLRGEQLRDIAVQFGARAREEKTERVQEIQRPVGNNRPRHEGHGALPAVDDFRHGRAQRGEVIGQTVAGVEKDGNGGELEQGGRQGGFHGQSFG